MTILKKINVRIGMPFLLLSVGQASFALIDLEDRVQEFILETKQIVIPHFPGAFNASIIEWQNNILLCFRVRNENMVSTFQIGAVLLDKEFNLISTPHIMEMRGKNTSTYAQTQDPRLINIDGKLYILYSNFIDIEEGVTARRMFVAQVVYENERFFIDNPVCIQTLDRLSKRWEKNWVPFNYNEELLLSYSLDPHHILKPSLQSGECISLDLSHSLIHWQWGELRGGTPALRDGDQYIGFFHSSVLMQSVHSKAKKVQHYFMGAYTFSAQPPFEITAVSPEPIVGKGFYHGQSHTTWKPLHVVFPMGYVMDDDYFWVSYGRQDHEIWIAKIDKKKLYESLIPSPRLKNKVQYTTSYQSLPSLRD